MIRADLPLRVLEPMLDRGELFIRLHTGSEYKIRRNGHTKRWKTRPDHFRIPVKFDFSGHTYLTHEIRNVFFKGTEE